MSRKISWEMFNPAKYQHPQRNWDCGHLADGHPCEIGPNAKGECCVQKICSPFFDGKTWHCNRPNAFGGKCHDGPALDRNCPDQNANCPHTPTPCQPVRSLRSKRRLLTGLTIALSLGFCIFVLGGSGVGSGKLHQVLDTTSIISPGPLTSAHATIEYGCQACHTAATQSSENLLSFASGGHHGIQESQKCLKCHDEFGNHALMPHSLPPETTVALTNYLMSQSAEPQHTTRQSLARLLTSHETTDAGELACATCHQEHHGNSHDLTKLTNAQCQSCHQQTFHSFANGHPEIKPPLRAGIHFDHVTHLKHHFQNFERLMPNGIPLDNCNDCHSLSSNRSTLDLASYKQMCGSCHDSQIRDFNMPSPMRLDHFEFLKSKPEIEEMPASLAKTQLSPLSKLLGFEIPVFLEMMLVADESTGQVLQSLPLGTNEQETAQINQVRSIIFSNWNRLIEELNTTKSAAVLDRLQVVCRPNTNPQQIQDCVDALNSSLFFQAIERYQSIQNSDIPESDEEVIGNWAIVKNRSALVYRASEHEDRLLKTWLDLLASQTSLSDQKSSSYSQNLFKRMFQERVTPGATGRCMKCHTFDKTSKGSFAINWETSHERQTTKEFTFFSHGPHLTFMNKETQSSNNETRRIQDCQSCHPLNPAEPQFVNEAFSDTDGMPHANRNYHSTLGLISPSKQNCAQCHQKQFAGDNCLQCHNYHIHSLNQ
ncbi:hypothetical protein [uncultured Rubinisphaera sp.]|uniref:hypothetical protein n=1 Tax=uncultured Rubinisphaera sp. TaxID=1678686 RepID=UPI0030DBD957